MSSADESGDITGLESDPGAATDLAAELTDSDTGSVTADESGDITGLESDPGAATDLAAEATDDGGDLTDFAEDSTSLNTDAALDSTVVIEALDGIVAETSDTTGSAADNPTADQLDLSDITEISSTATAESSDLLTEYEDDGYAADNDSE